jgi:hypothetical protein
MKSTASLLALSAIIVMAGSPLASAQTLRSDPASACLSQGYRAGTQAYADCVSHLSNPQPAANGHVIEYFDFNRFSQDLDTGKNQGGCFTNGYSKTGPTYSPLGQTSTCY